MAAKFLAWRVAALLGVALSAASLADSLRRAPLFCPLGGGCEAVTRSAYARPLGVPLPYLGLAGFGTFFLLALAPAQPAARALGPLALAAGFAGLGLAALQALVLKRYCRLCLAIDALAMLLALIELVRPAPSPDGRRPWRGPWLAALLLAVAGPLAAGRWLALAPPTPPQVLALQAPGTVTVAFYTDFQCAHCRLMHPMLRRLAAAQPGRVRIVLGVFPLPDHEHSRGAALAYLCAEAQGKGDAMAEALLAADDLSPAGCERIAERLGLDLPRWRACLASEAATARLGQTAWLKSAGVPGLPAIWIGERLFTGLQQEDAIREAIREEAARQGASR